MERVLIVEDEQLAVDKLKMLLTKIDPGLHVVAVLSSVSETVQWLSMQAADLVFLDINLSDDISFKIFEQIEVETPIIFTTAYDEYAIKAFKQNSLDYILKPVSQEELSAAIEKYYKYKSRAGDFDKNIKAMIAQYASRHYKSRLLINYGGKSRSIAVSDIAYLYAYEKGVYLTSFDNHTFLTEETLDTLHDLLDPAQFYRVNRKFLVNIQAIEEIHRYSTRRLKVDLTPPPKFDVIVPAEKIRGFKQWLNT